MSYRIPARRRSNSDRGVVIACVLLAIVVVGIVIAIFAAYRGSKTTVDDALIKDKQRECTGSGSSTSCKYIIYTDKGVFKDTDSLQYGKFNSSDVYNELDRGKHYDLTVVGWRIPLFSSYRNIIKVEPVG